MKMTPDTDESIRCSASGCSCTCFKPGSVQLRSCDRCGHTWVAHALEKLQFQAQQPSSCGPVEVALPGLVFDLSSLVLYGAQALPVRLKILLDRLYSILTPEQVGHMLHTLGWSLGDYVRGYMLQYPNGKVLDCWLMVTPEEELLILKQFLRFGETRPIVELMSLQLSDPELNPAYKSSQSNINTFIERNRGTPGVLRNTRAGIERFKKNSPPDHNDTVHHFENLPLGQSLLFPFHFPGSSFHCLVPPNKELLPPGKPTQCLRKPSGTKLTERQRQEGGRREQESDPILPPALKIKVDPDKPNLATSIWHQNPRFNNDQELDLRRGVAKQENTSSLSPPLTSSFIPTSYSLRPSVSTSPPKISQKLQGSSSYSLSPLPSFFSSFLCPLPSSSFSSSLHPLPTPSSSLRPLPSSICSLTSLSPTGGRKGRVCCGVCGKSFYDKGTLKIHYNAVHLKIKHRCTVAGCTMVFSSLRSRNRHSANPNPRLHTGAGRDVHTHRNTHPDQRANMHSETQTDKNTRKSMHNAHTHMCREEEVDHAHTRVHLHPLSNGHTNHQHGRRDDTPPQADSPPPSPHPHSWTLSRDADQNFTQSDCRSVLRPPPLLPTRSSSSLGSPPSLVPLVIPMVEKTERSRHLFSLHGNHTAPDPLPGPAPITTATCNSQSLSCDDGVTEGKRGGANQQRRWESGHPVPKKKPRKSSMPVKIEREKMEKGGEVEEEFQFSASVLH